MSLTISRHSIQSVTSLSDIARLSLGFVDGSIEWLKWAISTTSSRYDFPDETLMVAAVQQGLHASRLTLLPRLQLMVSPVKLMTMSAADLHVLSRAETSPPDSAVETQVRQILAEHRLLTQEGLADGARFVAELGVAHAPVFQALAFNDRLSLHALRHLSHEFGSSRAPGLMQEAAVFAVQQACTPPEFGDYYLFYLQQVAMAGPAATDAAQREALVTRTLHTLLPLLFGTLDCPQVGERAAPNEVSQAVHLWLSSGKSVGFGRLSQAVQQVALHSGYRNESSDAARRMLDQCLQSTRSFLASTRPQQAHMGQDGATLTFLWRADPQQAELQVDPRGVVSLRSLGSKTGRPLSIAADTVPF